MTNVDVKYKRPLVGRYNKSVCRCLNCRFSFYGSNLDCSEHGDIFDNINGFNELCTIKVILI